MSRNRRNQRPTPPEPTRAPISATEARDLGRELIIELAEVAGDPRAVRAVLNHWLDIEGTSRLSLASMSGLQLVFSTCLTRTPLGAWSLEPPPERKSP